ncbi:MAG: DUF3119 family protein [Moorea sp. SIO3I7]|uniref:DUF3119 family protein n=1 Tax=unclassified Moorena TaxID=2683338 RepID=UPI0013BF62D1|nr:MULTISPECIES: DUF3119 family protein [unclassified Moorena]NEN95784.1 DUF3119 family protein [Moorena sp. SIO3I7]NEO04838.1 DUF3119 family protein [Moorena sp. SIO3I8]NEO19540.1 DUF3119 family protein [Moorena sp. SIO4A5]NEQ60163.1 DUF3119 family protein [Moorena sp. SIO4A1]
MTSADYSPKSTSTVELSPSYTLPIVLIVAAVTIVLIQPWVSLAIALFGLFLLFQAVTIRLQFTETALDIYRSETLIRRFPYQEWQNWEIFWTSVPILFYFSEVKSIHFIPILFDPKLLRTCLEEHFPKI